MAKATFSYTLSTAGLDRLAQGLNTSLQGALEQLGEQIVADAKANAPRSAIDREGYLHLQDSIEAEVNDDLVLTVHDGVPHGIFVELGTQRMPARPWLTPAVERAREFLPDLVLTAIDRTVRDH